MKNEPDHAPTLRCLFCWMRTLLRFLAIPVCPICRDQMYDFLWVSAVQGVVALVWGLGVLFFIVEEVLLFTVLVIVKHRVPVPWESHE